MRVCEDIVRECTKLEYKKGVTAETGEIREEATT